VILRGCATLAAKLPSIHANSAEEGPAADIMMKSLASALHAGMEEGLKQKSLNS
jgi:hypothetical protein